jgi:hypothetical protein
MNGKIESGKTGISLSDLVAGDLIEIEVTGVSQSEKNGDNLLIVAGTLDDKMINIGLIGDKAIEGFLGHSEKTENGIRSDVPKIHASVEMTWINAPY